MLLSSPYVQLFAEPLQRRYLVQRFSCAYVFSLLCNSFLLVILPFFLCYSPQHGDSSGVGNGGVWLKQNTYREQPNVKFQHKFVLLAQTMTARTSLHTDSNNVTSTATAMVPGEIFYSTEYSINALRPGTLRMPSIRTREMDDDLDGHVDRLMLNAQIPLKGPEEQVFGVQAVIFFDFKLERHAKMNMECLAYASRNSGVPGRSFVTRGDLRLRQVIPLGVRDDNAISTLYLEASLLDVHAASLRASEANVETILERYEARSFATDYIERFPLWKTSPRGVSNVIDNNDENGMFFNFTITIDFPTQDIVYTPALFETMREGWIRYLSLLVVVHFLLNRVCRVVYENQLVTSRVKVDSMN